MFIFIEFRQWNIAILNSFNQKWAPGSQTASEKWFHDLSSWNKFCRQRQNKIFEYIGRNISAYAYEKINDELSTNLRHPCKFLNRHESRWQKIVPYCTSAGGPHRHRPAPDSWDLRLWLPTCTRTSTRKGYSPAAKPSVQRHYRTM